MKRKSKLTIATATAVLAVLGAAAVYAQDKYISPVAKFPRSRIGGRDHPQVSSNPRLSFTAWLSLCLQPR